MGHDQEHSLQTEWRTTVLKRLDKQDEKLDNISADIFLVKTSFVQTIELEKVKDKIAILEAFRYKFVGGLVVLQFVLTGVGYIINKLISVSN